VNAVSTMIGMALVNALIPPPKPPAAQMAASLAAPSPTYSLGAQGNQARIGQPIPVVYGRHISFPDFAAQPYTEYAGNEQYLYQLLTLGQGFYDIEQIRLEDTVIEAGPIEDGGIHTAAGSFEEIDYQIVQPGGVVTLFPVNVVTSNEVSGQEFVGSLSGTYSQSGTTITVTRAAHDLTVGKSVHLDFTSGPGVDADFTVVSVPTVDTFTVTAAASLTTSGNVAITRYLGPYVVNAAGTSLDSLAVDYVTTRGLYYATDEGGLSEKSVTLDAQFRRIDDAGAPLGSWTSFGTQTITAASTTPQRKSYKATVPLGRYEVRVRRTDVKDTRTRAGHDVSWAAARGYMPGDQTYGDVTMIALRMRASNQLSGLASKKINVIATRKVPIWNGTTWSAETATRSIAWALADVCRADYGLGLADSRVDLEGLLALNSTWTSRGDFFDGIFDSAGTAWETLQLIAKAGRAIPVMQGGVVHFVRDSAAVLPTSMFTTRNIARGSLTLEYLMPSEETADAVDVTYFDAATWQDRTVRCALPGSSEEIVAQVKLFGVTSRAQAYREGMYLAAANRYRRRTVTFTTEMEGLICTLGDLIAVQHDMPSWGQGGEVTAWNVGTLTLTLSEAADFSAGGNHYIALRRRDGSADGPYLCTAGASANQVVLAGYPTFTPYTGGDEERTHYAFGPGTANYIRARVIKVRPKTPETVEITSVVESDFVHTADTGATPTASDWQLATVVTQPVIEGLIAVSNLDEPEKMFLSWKPAPTADHYLIEIRDASNTVSGAGWVRIGEPRTSNYTATAQFGNRTMLRVCAVGVTRGPWVEINYGSSASYMWNAVDTTLMWDVNDTLAMWRY
jgi:hypothetical protein